MQTSDAFTVQTRNDSDLSQLHVENFFDNEQRSGSINGSVHAWSDDGSASEPSSILDFNLKRRFEGDDYTPGGTASMAYLAREYHDIFKSLEPLVQEMASDFLGYFDGEAGTSSRRYVADVFIPTDLSEINRIVEILSNCGGARRRGLFGFSVEDDHIHIIHDCSWGGSHCRCVFKEKVGSLGVFNRARKHIKRLFEIGKVEYYDIFTYYFVNKRGRRGLWINGTSGRLPTDAQLVRWARESCSREMVRIQNRGGQMQHKRQKGDQESGGANSTRRQEFQRQKSKAGLYGSIKSDTKSLLYKYWIAPMSGIQQIDEFRDNIILDNPNNIKYVNAAFMDFGKDIAKLKLREIYNILQEGKPLFFLSLNYGTMEESITWIDELLKFQFNDEENLISKFLTELVDILDRKLPKRNGFCVVSPPSAGKNFFFDMIIAICLNYGQLGMANKNNTFAFQEAVHKRLIVWNEPNYEPALTDTLKMMMAGDPYTVKVKHSLDGHVSRTPTIVLSNSYVPFMQDSAFDDRLFIYNWQAAPFLKKIDKKPYPMAFFELLKMYNVNF